MLRIIGRLLGACLCLGFIAGAFALKLAPDYLPPDRMEALYQKVPFLYYRVPQRSPRPEPEVANTTPQLQPQSDAMRAILAARPAPQQTKPVAQRKVVRVSD